MIKQKIMKFLDPNIFYPDIFDENYNKKQHLREISVARENYNNFLSQCKEKIDRRLLQLYEKTDRFHDYTLNNINFHTAKNRYFKSKKDSIELEIIDDEYMKIIHLYLEDIAAFKMDFDQLGWSKREKEEGLDEIVLCEIGYEDDYSFINFSSVGDAEISIYFKKAIYRIEKLQK